MSFELKNMKLKELIGKIQILSIIGNPKCEVTGVNIDSRKCEPSNMFMAMKGKQTDVQAYIHT